MAAADPAVAVEAHGTTILAADGREYLDAAGGAIVVNVGHGRASIADAMASQAGRRAHARGRAFKTRPRPAHPRRVSGPPPLGGPAVPSAWAGSAGDTRAPQW